MIAPVNLFELPHREARRLLRDTGAPVYLGVNPVEFHGPHLSLHNDRLIANGLSRALHEALVARRGPRPFLVVPDLELGCEPASGPGSRHARLRTLREAVLEAVRALAELGATRLVLNTFHGGALHNVALDDGVRLFGRLGGRAIAPFALALLEMVTLDPAPFEEAFELALGTEAEKRALRDGLRFDFHAGWFETSMALHYAPESVSDARKDLPPGPRLGRERPLELAARLAGRLGRPRLSAELDFLATAATWTQVRPFPGYTSRPDLATAASGAAMAGHIVARYVDATDDVFERGAEPPRPPFFFMRALTLDGRLDPTFVPSDQVRPDPTA